MRTILFFLLFTSFCSAQNILSLAENETAPKATITDAAFIEGHWKGEAFGGIAEEIWTSGLGNSMMFSFRLVIDGVVDFYEIGHIIEKDGTLKLQLKHFGPDLKGLEEKDVTQDYVLVKKEANTLYFDGITYSKINDSELVVYVRIKENGATQDLRFKFKKH